ncbi:MAG: L-lactate dehydrogenase [candidate division KSB1 bacterium]|nr:L-lactate dehydrogenase [candidate division KSB1 bacterium]
MNIIEKSSSKICIVGAGQVGSTFAYALMIRGLASEIVLIDKNENLAQGQAEDISHGLPYVQPAQIRAGDYNECENADIVVITAGAAQKPGESRLDLTKKNVDIFSSIVPHITKYTKDAILVVVSNPVDVLTYAAVKFSDLPPHRVLGSGTTLDSARFRYLLSQHCGTDSRNVHAYIIGEHGDSEVAAWSLVHISGVQLDDYCSICEQQCDKSIREQIFHNVKSAAYHLIEKKGATYHAIGLATLTILEAILRNQNSILTVSTLMNQHMGMNDVCLSVPTMLNRNGVGKRIALPLLQDEQKALHHSADVIKEAIEKSGLTK